MKLPSLRGLFASAASIVLLAGSLASVFPAAAAPPSATHATAVQASLTLELDKAVPAAAAEALMKSEGWTPVMSGYARKSMQETKGILSLWKQGETGKWRILQTTHDGQTKMTAEGNGLKLRAPANILAKQASIQNTPAPAAIAPEPSGRHIRAQKCGQGLMEAEINGANLSVIAEGVGEHGAVRMTLAVNYYADDGYTPVTWAVYYTPANDVEMSCRVEAGFGINFDRGFAEQKPLDYPNPKLPMVPG